MSERIQECSTTVGNQTILSKRVWLQPAVLAVSLVAVIIVGLLATTFAQSPASLKGVPPIPNLPASPVDTGTRGFVEFAAEPPPTSPRIGILGFATIDD
jgi:hypothetical protein